MEPILLRVSNFKAYVWDVDDINALRSQHRVCGTLIGTLPHLSSQNIFLGLPFQLMPEEAVLLVENEIAVLVDDSAAHHPPSPSALTLWQEECLSDATRQLASTEETESIDTFNANRVMSETAQRKRREREERRARANTNVAPSIPTVHLPPTSNNHSQPASEKPPGKAVVIPVPSYTVHVPASSSALKWYTPHSHFFSTITRGAHMWKYPSTLQERARCGVFRHLWEQGFYLGGGMKFGGEYLVYPGDPLRYHSHFVASVIEDPNATIRPMEIVAHGRLGTGTKKAHLLCEWNDSTKVVSCFSIEWAGFG